MLPETFFFVSEFMFCMALGIKDTRIEGIWVPEKLIYRQRTEIRERI